MVFTLTDAVIHVVNDFLNVKRIAIGASSLHLTDERQRAWCADVLVTTPSEHDSNRPPAWADLSWGLRENVRTLQSSLPNAVQFSVFMTPGWGLMNFGAENLNATIHELSWIWCFLEEGADVC